MLQHPNASDEVLDLASSYALGLLQPPETAEFERHLQGCPVCREEVKAIQGVSARMALAAPTVQPAPRVKQQLLAGLRPEHVIFRAEEGAWEATPYPGIEVRRLFVDKVTGAITTLLRAAAGAVYPAHRHGGTEQVYVIDGDLIFEDHKLETGDYEISSGSTEHLSITTETGCTALIIHNLADKVHR